MQPLAVSFSVLFFALSVSATNGQGIKAVEKTQATPPVSARPTQAQKSPIQMPNTYKKRQVMVGSGGGVTGGSVTYYFLDDGRLYGKRSRDKGYTFIGQQKPLATKRVFETVESKCNIAKTKFDKPGNLYQFVGWQKGKQRYQVTWAKGDSTVPANYPKFYKAFMDMVPVASRLK